MVFLIRRILLSSALVLFPLTSAAQSCDNWYEVQSGDTLSRIADRAYGSVREYEKVYQANLEVIGPDPARIEIGMRLYLPCETVEAPASEPVVVAAPVVKETTPFISVAGKLTQAWDLQPDINQVNELINQNAVQVLDIRPAKSADKGMMPGAISLPLDLWRPNKSNPGQPPSDLELSQLVGQAGLRLDLPIVIVNSNSAAFDTGRGAFVYWILKSAGGQQLALMTGGFKAWKTAGLPIADFPGVYEPYKADLILADTWRATADEVREISLGNKPGVLVDARPDKFFNKRSKDGTQLASTLPGASNLSVPASHSLLKKTNNDPLALLMRLKDQSVNWQNEPVVNFCDTGELGALNWFHASEVAGIANVKLYPESSHGWVEDGRELSTAIPAD